MPEGTKTKCPKCKTIHIVPLNQSGKHLNCLKCGSWINSSVHEYVKELNSNSIWNKHFNADKIGLYFLGLVGILFLGIISYELFHSSYFKPVIGVILIVVAMSYKPLRKTLGLLIVILGAISCLSIIGMVIGIPMILVGGFLIFD